MIRLLAIATLLLAIATTNASAQSGVYLRLGDITGETVDGPYKGWISLESIETEWAESDSQVYEAGRKRNAIAVGAIMVSKSIDAATPALMKNVATRAVVAAGAIVVVRDGTPLIRYDLRNVSIAGYTMAASAEETLEEVALGFDEILITYLPETKSPLTGSFQWNLLR